MFANTANDTHSVHAVNELDVCHPGEEVIFGFRFDRPEPPCDPVAPLKPSRAIDDAPDAHLTFIVVNADNDYLRSRGQLNGALPGVWDHVFL
ncbi:MAG TPA: hypothetical protein DEG88_10470 [Propionibacteriaceae bacterium]|nr:hypothetical protein [Propionibacteriaceae bacterium]